MWIEFFSTFLCTIPVFSKQGQSHCSVKKIGVYSHTVCLLWMKITEPVSHAEVLFCDLVKRGRWWTCYPIPSLREQPQARQHPPLSKRKVCPHLWTLALNSELTSLALTNPSFHSGICLRTRSSSSGPFPDHRILNCPLSCSPIPLPHSIFFLALTLFAVVLFIYFLLVFILLTGLWSPTK